MLRKLKIPEVNLVVAGLVLVAACGGNVIVDQPSAGSGGTTSTSTVTTTGTGACPDGGKPIPAQLKSCSVDTDCSNQLIYVDCCGRQEAIGVSITQLGAFHAFEKACNPFAPVCDCDPGPTLTEDGSSVPPDAELGIVQVACMSGFCSTFIP